MNKRETYAQYISAALRHAMRETRIKFPEECFIITNYFSDLAQFDELVGMKVLVTNIPSSFDWSIGFNSEEESSYKLLKQIYEFQELYSIEEYEKYKDM